MKYKKTIINAKKRVKQVQIVLERSARLNLDHGKGDKGCGGGQMIICKRPDPPDDHLQVACPLK